ncbi:MAG: hypothetical protein ACAI34_19360 [Verrucomicrobium sp.]|nr:hypothetical protein [Verrucomicrobium sp.]
MNTYAIDTTYYGTFLAWGNNQLLDRIAEISAIRRMDAVMATKAYADAVEEAADEEEDAADDIVPPAVDSIQEVHSGIGKFFHRIGQDIKKDRDEEKRHDYQSFQYKSTAGVAKAKRDLCRKLGINPYSTNPILQARLDGLSRALGLGGFTMVLGEASADPIASAVAANRGTPPAQLATLVYDKSLSELHTANQTAMQLVGISPLDATAFLSSSSYTPWQQTQLVLALQSLAGVKGLDLFLRDATASATEQTDAIFYTETAQLMGKFQTSLGQIARIEKQNNAPFCILRDDSVLLALHWDYASWTPTADKCAKWLQSLQVNGKKPTSITIAITGAASPRLRLEMEQRGFRVLDRQDRGPLN